jgi:RTX calcium-binding nonapeptide repeat (4 copies)
MELSSGDEANTTWSIAVSVSPVADPFLMVANNLVLNVATGIVDLDLSVRMSDSRGGTNFTSNITTNVAEVLAEIVSLTFSGVPPAFQIFPKLGGRIQNPTIGTFTFVGTPAQANALTLVRGPGTESNSLSTVSISGVSLDGSSVLASPITDTFLLSYGNPTTTGRLVTATASPFNVTGGSGNDILRGINGSQVLQGGAGHDLLIGGPGADNMTGGTGRDSYMWAPSDLSDSAVDIITDFVAGEDLLNLTGLFNGTLYDYQSSASTTLISNFVSLTKSGGSTSVIRARQGATFVSVVQLLNTTSLTVSSLLQSGSLLL